MKKYLALTLSVLMLSACLGSGLPAAFADGPYTPGTYTATADGMGVVTATVTVDESKILEVVLDVSNETETVGALQGDALTEQVMAAQSAEIDGVSGATVTSTAVKKAVQACLDQAMGLSSGAEQSTLEGNEADVIVIGAGGAGLTAAISAAEAGASVIVLESQATAGGTAKISAVHYSVINDEWNSVEGARDERLEQRLSAFLDYDPADFGDYADALVTLQEQVKEYLASDDTTNFDSVERMLIEHYVNVILTPGPDKDGVEAHAFYDLTRAAYEDTMSVYNFLLDHGITFEDGIFDIRSLTPTGEGSGFTNTMVESAKALGVRFDYRTEGRSLIVEDGRVVGVNAVRDGEEIAYRADKGVVIATGGFGSNREMIAQYDNRYAITTDTPSSETPGATGLGITMAQEIGADTVDMQFIQVFPFPAYDDAALMTSLRLMGNGKMAVNADAERFADDSDLGPYGKVSVAARDEEGCFFYLVSDAESLESLQQIGENVAVNSIFYGDTLEEAAEAAGLDPDVLRETVDRFNSYVENENDPDFGRTQFKGKIETAPFIIMAYADKVQQTMGGLLVDVESRVLDTDGNPIPGLYAAGEVTGGLEGADRVHGDNYAEIFYFGMIAGENAAA